MRTTHFLNDNIGCLRDEFNLSRARRPVTYGAAKVEWEFKRLEGNIKKK